MTPLKVFSFSAASLLLQADGQYLNLSWTDLCCSAETEARGGGGGSKALPRRKGGREEAGERDHCEKVKEDVEKSPLGTS